MTKIQMSANKHLWHPSVLPGQIVIVSTISESGEVNLAPKSWVTMASFQESRIVFGCNTSHLTYQNIVTTGQYVINIPGEDLVGRIWALAKHHGSERIETSGLTFGEASHVSAPIVMECHAHLEVEFDEVLEWGEEVLIIGKIVHASIDQYLSTEHKEDPYSAMRPIFFLEDGTYGCIERSCKVYD